MIFCLVALFRDVRRASGELTNNRRPNELMTHMTSNVNLSSQYENLMTLTFMDEFTIMKIEREVLLGMMSVTQVEARVLT